MKKSIIALAVASAATFAQADNTTLYGSVRMAYTYDKADNASATSNIGNSGSRFGIKGSDDLGNGLEAFYKYENRIGANLGTNKLYAGLKGGFGSVSFGKQNLPADAQSNNSDPFNALTPGDRTAKTGSDNSLVYYTPEMGGFKMGAAIVANAADATAKHVDFYDVTVAYEANGIYAGLGYQADTADKSVRTKTTSLGLGYANDAFSVGLVADRTKAGSMKAKTFARLSGAYNISEMDSVYAGVSKTFQEGKDPVAASLGYQHKLSNRTRVWAEYGYEKAANDAKSSKVSLGLRTDF